MQEGGQRVVLRDGEDYRDKVILAPMVRVGTLPFRLLALEHGADIVFGEEIIDRKIMKSKREIKKDGLIEFTISGVKGRRTVVFSTCPQDHPNVFQMGTASSTYALQAANVIVNDIDGIDINMGCPKHFSIQGGMGAALLNTPEIAADIIKTLRRNVNVPVTAKIRLLPTLAESINFVQAMEKAGAQAITIHARLTPDRPVVPARIEMLRDVVKNAGVCVPLIHNGDVFVHSDIATLKNRTGVDSIMIARGAIKNPSIFSPTPAPLDEMIKRFLDLSIQYDNIFQNIKYSMLRMLGETENGLTGPEGKALTRAKTIDQICKIWDVQSLGTGKGIKRSRERDDEKILADESNRNPKRTKKNPNSD